MIKLQIQELKVVFTDSIPIDLVDGFLYISMEYCMAKHKCPCGCGLTVITPILPKRWHLYYDGETISLSPSIGNYQFCGSHYFIRKNKIVWAIKREYNSKTEPSTLKKFIKRKKK
jgi:hypothetical protein